MTTLKDYHSGKTGRADIPKPGTYPYSQIYQRESRWRYIPEPWIKTLPNRRTLSEARYAEIVAPSVTFTDHIEVTVDLARAMEILRKKHPGCYEAVYARYFAGCRNIEEVGQYLEVCYPYASRRLNKGLNLLRAIL